MDHTRLSFLFYRYINNNCSESERHELLRLLADPANDSQVKALMSEVWDQTPGKDLTVQQSNRIFGKIVSKRRPADFSWLKAAAVFALMVLSVLAVLYSRNGHHPLRVAQKATGVGKTDFIALSDGSTVILNAGSNLQYAEVFSDNIREVFLEGEAFFDIKHDSSRTFVVHTGKLRTTVLGTAFNISAYPGQEVVVTVKRGKVSVGDETRVLGIINPNEQVALNPAQKAVERQPVDSHRVTAWIERDILFEDVTMSDAIFQLAKRFNVPIALEDQNIAACKFTATFVQGEDVEQILKVLCVFNNATLEGSETDGYLISGGDCGVAPDTNVRYDFDFN